MMRPWHVRRLLFGLFLVQEGVIWARSTPEQRTQAPPVKRPALFGALLLLPFFWRLRRPAWLERLALALQLGGWLLELAAMSQLMRNDSFGVHPTAATTGVQSGLYRLEHPIYLGLLTTQLGWTLTCPPSWPVLLLFHRSLRQAIAAERQHLMSLQIHHRGPDSALWGQRPPPAA
jgi:protein-S-isoprenylcysteine O-methyltransferase Ste14